MARAVMYVINKIILILKLLISHSQNDIIL